MFLRSLNISKWVGGRLAAGELEMVQPVLIAFDFEDSAIVRVRNSELFKEKK